jgi:serine kinase of HPr protein (carbohydrate metabolism regulator)
VAEWDRLIVSTPARIFGSIEVRGLGIVTVPSHTPAELVLVVDLIGGDQPVERLPDPVTVEFEGIAVPLMGVHPFEASSAIKVLMALQAASAMRDAD